MGRDRVVRRYEQVPAGAAGLQLGEKLFVRAEDADLDFGSGELLEFVEVLGIVIVGPSGERDLVADAAGEGGPGAGQLRHRLREHGGGEAEAGHAEELAPADRPVLVAPGLVNEFSPWIHGRPPVVWVSAVKASECYPSPFCQLSTRASA